MIDILKFVVVDTKPEAGDLYVDETNKLYKCENPEYNDKVIGWPGIVNHKIVCCLEKTSLSLSV